MTVAQELAALELAREVLKQNKGRGDSPELSYVLSKALLSMWSKLKVTAKLRVELTRKLRRLQIDPS